MKDIDRRLERLEGILKDRPVDVSAAVARVQEATEGLQGPEWILTAMAASKQASPEHDAKVFIAWMETLSADEVRLGKALIKQIIEEIKARLEADDPE